MQRIYLPNTHFWETLSISEKELYHQITRVLRARVGQKYTFFDGVSREDCIYEISEIDAQKVVFFLLEKIQKPAEDFPEMHLYQALANKLEKLEYIVQKSCEIGYLGIHFFQSERSQILQLSENKKDRLRKIAIEAIEQCGGNIIPKIEFLEQFSVNEDLCSKEDEKIFFCHTQSDNSQNLKNINFSGMKKVSILVGPEWGFSPQEAEKFRWKSFVQVYFGSRIFRTETVAPLLWFYIQQKTQD